MEDLSSLGPENLNFFLSNFWLSYRLLLLREKLKEAFRKRDYGSTYSSNKYWKPEFSLKSTSLLPLSLTVLFITHLLLCSSVVLADSSGGNINSDKFGFDERSVKLVERSRRSIQQMSRRKVYTNKYAIKIEGGSLKEANRIAIKYGFTNLGPVSF